MKISKPVRVRRTYTQALNAAPKAVFPLLCPVREVEWVKGWDPWLVIAESGLVEDGCVFVMPDQPADSVWVVTRWDSEEHEVEFVKVTPGLAVGRIHISMEIESASAPSIHSCEYGNRRETPTKCRRSSIRSKDSHRRFELSFHKLPVKID